MTAATPRAAAAAWSAERLTDVGRGIELCHQSVGDPADPPLLLVMGLAMQMVAWPDELCEAIAGRGFCVVRFDNRDIGLSTQVDTPVPSPAALLLRRFPRGQYTLADMAEDTAGLVRALQLGRVHVVGASMGGGIAQSLAARHPELVRSLVSIMSTTGSARAGRPAPAAYPFLLRRVPRQRQAYADRAVRLFRLIGSPGFAFDEAAVRERALRGYDRAFHPEGAARQLAAVVASGDRTAELRRITAPTLVIHGSADRLVSPSGGRATAAAIPGASLMTVEGMGHDLPREVWPRLVDAIVEHARRADGSQE